MMSVSVYYNKVFMLQAIQNKRVKICLLLLISFGILSLLVSFFLPAYRELVYLFWLSVTSNMVIPFTLQEPLLLLYGQLYSPFLVTIIAVIATIIMESINYQILVPVLEINKIKIFREKRFYQLVESYFSKFPFLSLVASCLAPVPLFPFRLLAVTTRYPIKKYILSIFIGRIPLYYLLALTGQMLNLPSWIYITSIAGVFAMMLLKKLDKRMKGSN
jgi:membrane protein YqaA with SNARE-associated domain